MRRELVLATLALTTVILAAAQQSTPPAQSTNIAPVSGSTQASGASQPSNSAAFQIVPPFAIAQPNPSYSSEARKKKISGTCLVSFTVDTNGIPQSVRVVKSLEPSLDTNAVQAIETWRFKPARKEGKTSVPFDLTAEVSFRIMDIHRSESATSVTSVIANPADSDDLGTVLSYDGSRLIRPIPVLQIAPKYPSDEKRHRINGDCLLALIIDSEGIPQDIHIVKSLGPAFDESAIEAVKKWRYKPASRDGVPIPMKTHVIVKFDIDGHHRFW